MIRWAEQRLGCIITRGENGKEAISTCGTSEALRPIPMGCPCRVVTFESKGLLPKHRFVDEVNNHFFVDGFTQTGQYFK